MFVNMMPAICTMSDAAVELSDQIQEYFESITCVKDLGDLFVTDVHHLQTMNEIAGQLNELIKDALYEHTEYISWKSSHIDPDK